VVAVEAAHVVHSQLVVAVELACPLPAPEVPLVDLPQLA
jgi:hypothetical protein